MDDLDGLAHYDSIMIKCGSDKLTRVYNKWREEFELVQIYYVRGSSIPSFISIWLQSARLHSLGGVFCLLYDISIGIVINRFTYTTTSDYLEGKM